MEPWYWLSQILFLHLCQRLWDSRIVPLLLEAGSSKHVQSTPKALWQLWKFNMLSLTGAVVRALYNGSAVSPWFPQKKLERGKLLYLRMVRLLTPSPWRYPGHPAVDCTDWWEAVPDKENIDEPQWQKKNENSWYQRKDRPCSAVFCSGYFPQQWGLLDSYFLNGLGSVQPNQQDFWVYTAAEL